MKSLRFVMFIGLALWLSHAQAQFRDFSVNRLSSVEELSKLEELLATTPDDKTGLAKGLGWDLQANPKPLDIDLADEVEGHQFHLGEYVVMCFTPEKDMYIRLMDTKPNGGTAQLYPVEGSVAVAADTRYCIGNRDSEVLVYADEATGLGKGTLYLLGVEAEEDFPDVSTIANIPPGWEQSGLAWLTKPAGSLEIEVEDDKLYEAYFNYEILEPADE